MKKQKKPRPHTFILERDFQYTKGFPDTLPLPSNFLPENEFFKPKEAVVEWDFYTIEWVMASTEYLPIEDNQLILKKWLSKRKLDYERDETGRKIRGKNFSEIAKIQLKIERIICERVKEKRTK